MVIPKRGERGFTLIELLIVVAILGILAAVVVPNVGRFLGRGKSEAQDTEYQNIITAVSAMMVDNSISTLPSPRTGAGTGCTTSGWKDMREFPDNSTIAQKDTAQSTTAWDTGDKTGFILFGHDAVADNAATATVNYMAANTSTYCYLTTADGTVTQYDTAGVQLNP